MSGQWAGSLRACLFVIASGAGFANSACAADARYPDWTGAWVRREAGTFDPARPAGLPQAPPLNEEYQKVFEKSVADQAAGGQGNNPMAACVPPGMPRMTIGYGVGLEFIVTPDVTYVILGEPMMQVRRIFTDGRAWPKDIEPAFTGYSIGRWEAAREPGVYDTLVVETRAVKGPRAYDSSGMPFHKDNSTLVFERISLDRANPDILRDEVTTHDKALTRPWSVNRTYHRKRQPIWQETTCGEDEHQVKIQGEHYFLDADGFLTPTRRGQPPPVLKNFPPAK